ncbi:hypothetical protein phytr_8280 [Candidatus Phycorickettsia trachydisci]|uniref:HemY N-terminal domain-containing protein n=1 Tax=Candidatus Phycorickettsia trachydisci TaxID=2115978 RepID=A0A2P1P916_9RICK|nr:hypothetical protein [Candidatus Phycorickettsia trachydisci]AVP87760.1 hypothetical protein phytr_8280 [Candidatus Phycorickettsia trachydisci]
MQEMRILKTFFFLSLILLLLGLLAYVQSYSSVVEIRFGQYVVLVNLIVLILLLLALKFAIYALIHTIRMPFVLFRHAIDKAKQIKEQKLMKQVCDLTHQVLLGSTDNVQKTISKLLSNSDLPKDVDEHLRILLLKIDTSFNTKLYYTKEILSGSSPYKFLIARNLASQALKEESYHYSLELASTAFKLNDKDPDLLELMIDIYAALESWNKMEEMMRLLDKVDKERMASIKDKISDYYLKAAKQFIGLGQISDSGYYLKKCLEYKPDFIECIELISQIQIELKGFSLQKIIEDAFALRPDFALFKIYYKHFKNSMSSEDMYNNLSKDLDKSHHVGILISIAYFLNIKKELDSMVLPFV